MQAQLRIRLSDDETVEATTLDGTLSEDARARLHGAQELGGTVTLVHEGQPDLEILDELDVLIPRLCLYPLAPLAAGQAVTVALFTSTQTVSLTPQGAQTAAAASWGPNATYPTGELIEALGRCAVQYAGFLARNLAGEDRVERLNRAIRTTKGAPPLPQADSRPPALSEQEMREIMAEMQDEG